MTLLLSTASVDSESMLDKTVNHAATVVSHGVARLRIAVASCSGRQPTVPRVVQAATRELYRTYVALMVEASRIGRFGPDELGSLTALQRSRLVTRVHQTVGNFPLIESLIEPLHARAVSDDAVDAVEEVLRSWADREVHLFGILVPLAAEADALCSEVRAIVTLPSQMAKAIDSRCQLARRAVAPAYRQLARITRLLQEFAEELKQLTGVATQSLDAARLAAMLPFPKQVRS